MIDVGAITHEVRLGDCLDDISGLAALPDQSIDHACFDPPYEKEAHTKQVRASNKGPGQSNAVPFELDFAAITEQERNAIAAHLARVVRRWTLTFCQAEGLHLWRAAFEAAGMSWRRAGLWVKPDAQPQLTGDRPGTGAESIAIAHAKGRSRWNGGGRPGVWTFPKNEQGREHPTQKPLMLMEALIRDFTDPGEIILDLMAGSGTTGVACKRLGRRFLGWERKPAYHAIAASRIAGAREQLSLIGHRKTPGPKQADLLLTENP